LLYTSRLKRAFIKQRNKEAVRKASKGATRAFVKKRSKVGMSS
jgi:hypothetical protein